ncbi:hypothetical protein FIBSPDRAFT_1040723 [Athelia psychrophila]|uniref:Uncharacterized protein n=1 Tax=Athelia psychrophila TaxID=1759441 RepID=A0A166PTX8_9AGAM|nr:hypothetical protein FIBSPDRAFT_1040723 [Fibularhizoctonia sp. CBS 109695]
MKSKPCPPPHRSGFPYPAVRNGKTAMPILWQVIPHLPALHIHISRRKSCRDSRKRVLAKLGKSGEAAGADAGADGDDVVMGEAIGDAPAEYVPAPPAPRAPLASPGPGDHDKVKRWVEPYPKSAGETKGIGKTDFVKVREWQVDQDQDPWAPFESQDSFQGLAGRWIAHI